ncbi:MAG: chloride channel protein [Acidimicrobiia bacterium]
MRRIVNFLRSAWKPDHTAGLMLVAVVVGALVGVAAYLLVEGIALVADGTGEVAEALPGNWLWMFIMIPLGLTVAWWLAERFAPEVAGDGVPQVAAALIIAGGHVRRRVASLKIIATSITLGVGGSAGREGPIVQIGSAVGSALARWTGLSEQHARSLVAAGAGAGIGASFNAPIAGMLFAMEVVLGGFHIRHLNTVVVASVSAAVVSRSLVGSDLSFPIVKYPLTDARELLAYAAVGLLAVVAAYLFLRSLTFFEDLGPRLSLPKWAIPASLGLVVAFAGLASTWIYDEADAIAPDVLRTGQDFVGFLVGSGSLTWWVLGALALLKIIATSATMGSGASGGAFAPSLFIGAAVGSGFAALIEPVWGFSELRPGALALVGMSAVFAAVARAPLTSILIVFEITQDYGLVLPLMLATTLATLLTEVLHRESVYTMALTRMGIRRTQRGEVDVLDTVSVGEVMSTVPVVVSPTDGLDEVQETLDRIRHHGLPVTEDGRLVGIVTVTDILRLGGPSESVMARDAMTPDPTTVNPNSPVSLAMERMAVLGVGRLPVVAADDPEHLLGMFRREDAVRAYHHALSSEVNAEMGRQRLRARVGTGAEFFSFLISEGSIAAGRALREVAWPDGCTLVSVQRGRQLMVPEGSTMLRVGDVITAFGTPGAEDRVKLRLNAPREFSDDDIGS